jgi:predicted ribosome quality control (RQC) complex YloA/Tae2 family protein
MDFEPYNVAQDPKTGELWVRKTLARLGYECAITKLQDELAIVHENYPEVKALKLEAEPRDEYGDTWVDIDIVGLVRLKPVEIAEMNATKERSAKQAEERERQQFELLKKKFGKDS